MSPNGDGLIFYNAALRIYAPHDLHAELRNRLDLNPTLSAQAGEIVSDPAAPTGKTFPADVWLVVAPVDVCRPINEHLSWIIEKARPNVAYLKKLVESGIHIDIWCTCTTNGVAALISIDPTLIASLAHLELPVSVRFAALPQLGGTGVSSFLGSVPSRDTKQQKNK
ncbi:MAG: DUF4279 domain-containing protein [Candidatus Omnitrophica bacterium]|nr:DUF4279 domain-containing protein [Candidatus Omnitrophota bacterium]